MKDTRIFKFTRIVYRRWTPGVCASFYCKPTYEFDQFDMLKCADMRGMHNTHALIHTHSTHTHSSHIMGLHWFYFNSLFCKITNIIRTQQRGGYYFTLCTTHMDGWLNGWIGFSYYKQCPDSFNWQMQHTANCVYALCKRVWPRGYIYCGIYLMCSRETRLHGNRWTLNEKRVYEYSTIWLY